MFAPHPDDETFGCGGTIARRVSEGYDVLIVVMTDGRYAFLKMLNIDSDPTPEELKEIRKEEVKRATKILGVPEENLIFLNFEDGTLRNSMEEAERKVTEILKMYRPVEVYFPYKSDVHPDHQAAYHIVKGAVARAGFPINGYQYSTFHKYMRLGPIIDRTLGIIRRNIIRVDVSKFLSKKEAAIKEFKSELSIISNVQKNPLIKAKDIKNYLKSKELFLK
ncbi:MAG: PIG-L family deacetylase [Candidatus Bathyarchaeia archaeon]